MKTVNELLKSLSKAGLDSLSDAKQEEKFDIMQRFLVESIEAYNKIAPIRFDFDTIKPAKTIISEILLKAEARHQIGPVAQHFVGAVLAIRFPHLEISNYAHNHANEPSGRLGDFFIGDTVFLVTATLNKALMEKCHRNIRAGSSVFLLVVDSKLTNVEILLEMEKIADRVSVESIESFVGLNLSELAEFSTVKFGERLGELLREYNRRVTEAETDSSLLIEIPVALGGPKG